MVAFADESIQTNSLQHMNTQMINDYIATMIMDRGPEIKATVVNGAEITNFKLNDATFDILTGKLLVQFTTEYKKKDVSGTLGFEIRVSDDVPQKIGGYCLGLEGGLHSKKILTNFILAFTSNHINKSLVGKEFWSDKLTHNQFKVFKNENLTYIANQALIVSGASDNQFKEITQSVPGGKMKVEFQNVNCNSFDLSTGQAQINADISANIESDFTGALSVPNAGKLEAFFDFYINPADKSWWVKLSKFNLNINFVTPELNDMIQEKINKKLNSRQILIPLDMPKSNDAIGK
jgi:hypothetical protein